MGLYYRFDIDLTYMIKWGPLLNVGRRFIIVYLVDTAAGTECISGQ